MVHSGTSEIMRSSVRSSVMAGQPACDGCDAFGSVRHNLVRRRVLVITQRRRGAAPSRLAYALQALQACPQDVPNRHQQPTAATISNPVNMKLARGLERRATHRNTLVIRSSLGDDEDQGAEVPAVVRSRRRRARCVPDQPVNAGNSRSRARSSLEKTPLTQR